MNLKRWMCILILLIFCYINGNISKICHDEKRNGRNWHCCNNHQEINGSCFKCGIGFFSDAGEICRKCPNGVYGLLCVQTCKCKGTESCHHIKGCIQEEETTLIVGKASTSSHSKTHRVTYRTSSSLAPFTTTNIVSLPELTTENNKFSQTTSSDGNRFVGLSDREIAVYSVSIGVCTGLGLVILCLGRYSLKLHRYRSVLLHTENTRNNVTERDMIDAPLEITVPMTVETAFNTTDDEQSPYKNECLNPYQPLVPDVEKHAYDLATHFTSDNWGASESEENSSRYWNPSNQQTVAYSAYENYFSVKAECHSLGSSIFDENAKKHDNKKEKTLELMEYKEETNNYEEMDLHNPHLNQCL